MHFIDMCTFLWTDTHAGIIRHCAEGFVLAIMLLVLLHTYCNNNTIAIFFSASQDGLTPLITAAWFGKWDVVSELLDDGADIDAQSNVSHFPCDVAENVCKRKKDVLVQSTICGCRLLSYFPHEMSRNNSM